MKNLYRWIMLGALLVSQISVQASNPEEIDEINNQKIQKSDVKATVRTEKEREEDYQKGIFDHSSQEIKDLSTNLLLMSVVNPSPLGSWGPKNPEIKVLNFRNNLLTDSGAINLACCLDYL
ncbi:MAG: hypothetical protein ACRYGR_09730 [Janthinobacterium lividum]